MTTRRFLVLLSASLIVIAGAMYLSSLRHLDRDPRGQVFLAGLDTKLDVITDVRLRKGSAKPSVSLHRIEAGKWAVVERDNYPADVAKIRKLLLALSEAKIVEEKTSNPASYAVLGVEDPAEPAANGVEVNLVVPAASTAVIVGRAAGNGSYVRRMGEAKSFAVEPAISVESSARDWIDSKLLDLPVDKFQSLRVKLPDGGSYALVRKAGTDGKDAKAAVFALQGVPPGREPNDAATLAPSPSSFSGVTADDVAPAASIDFSKAWSAQIQLSDGSVYTLSGTAIADKHWITVNASKDDALNARTQGRAFEVASYRFDAIFRPLEQFLKPKPEKAAAAKTSKKPADQL